MVGVIGLAVNIAAFVFCTEVLGMHYALAAIVASQVSTLNNFILTELWVFRGREARRHIVVRYLTFNALNVATLAVRVPLLVLITEWIGLAPLVSNVIAIGVTFGIRYFIAENWIWAGRDARDQSAVRRLVPLRHPRPGALELADRPAGAGRIQHARRRSSRTSSSPGASAWVACRDCGSASAPRTASSATGSSWARPAWHSTSTWTRVIRIEPNWLLAWSHHVLYTNVVEPLLRFLLRQPRRGAAALRVGGYRAGRPAHVGPDRYG